MDKKTFAVLATAGGLAGASLTYGVATAADAPKGPNSGGGSGVSAPAAVPATSAGMPRTAQTLWAVVNADGTLARGFGTAASPTTKLTGLGAYEVRFSQNLTGCTYQATIGQASVGAAPHGHITTAARSGVANGVYISTGDTTGANADRPFHLAVHC